MGIEWTCALDLPAAFPELPTVISMVEGLLEAQSRFDSLTDTFGLHLMLVDDERIRQINFQARNKNQSTDVLSFPLLPFKVGPGSSVYSALAKPASVFELLSNADETFPAIAKGQPVMLGDLVISVVTCASQAEQLGHSFKDEFYRLLVHGILHLFGYDHETSESDKMRMEICEDRLLEIINH